MIHKRGHWIVLGYVLLGAAAGVGCREHYPHSCVWPATGDVIYTHPKPPEGGYHTDWDPYAATIELEPVEDINPVGTQHVLVATVRDKEGKPLPNRRVEWIIADPSVGDIIEVDESGFRASRGYKQGNDFAVSHTNNNDHVLNRGNADPNDDICLTEGQTWCTITSPVEGTTHIIAYAPGIYDWDKHKVFAKKHWYDVAWEWPPPGVNPTGTSHTFTTKVMKYSDGAPLPDYIVNYEITSGPEGMFDASNASTASVTTDNHGLATVVLTQVTPAAGTNDIQIDITRPEDKECCKPGVHIATGQTQKTWIAPGIAIEKSAPATAIVGEEFSYQIRVSSTAEVPAEDVVVTDVLPDGIEYVSSQPGAEVSGQSLTWRLGTMGANTSSDISVRVRGLRTGRFTNCAEVRAAQGLSDRACADTVITAPELILEKRCPSEVVICDPIPYTIVVRNPGDAPATNVQVVDDLPSGIQTTDGRQSVTVNIGTLDPGQAKQIEINAKANNPGSFTNTARASADRGLSAEASCATIVRQPVLVITKTGPDVRYIGRPVEYQITVTNQGDTDARNTNLVDTLPSGATFVEASDNGQFANGKVTWSLGTLAPNGSRTVSLAIRMSKPGQIRNAAAVQAYCTEAAADIVTQIKGIPAILLEVIDLKDPIEVDGQETYVITVVNQGSAELTNVVIACTIPEEQEFVSAEGPASHEARGKAVNFAPLPSLGPKAKVVYRVITKGVETGDSRFRVTLTGDQMRSRVEETESTNIY